MMYIYIYISSAEPFRGVMAHSAITIFQASMRKGTWADEDLEKHEKQIEQKRPSVAGVGVGALSVESA